MLQTPSSDLCFKISAQDEWNRENDLWLQLLNIKTIEEYKLANSIEKYIKSSGVYLLTLLRPVLIEKLSFVFF
jgi:hypothetical protein